MTKSIRKIPPSLRQTLYKYFSYTTLPPGTLTLYVSPIVLSLSLFGQYRGQCIRGTIGLVEFTDNGVSE